MSGSNPLTESVLYLVGPTASGKSAVALELAQRIGGELVNADAFQLYAGLPVCTAQPSADEQALVPHHLYGCLSVESSYDAQAYSDRAVPVIAEIACPRPLADRSGWQWPLHQGANAWSGPAAERLPGDPRTAGNDDECGARGRVVAP